MRMPNTPWPSMNCLALLLALSLLYGCGAATKGSLPSTQSSPNRSAGAASLSISPQKAALHAGNSLQFTAAVFARANADLAWLVNGVLGGNSASGTISRSGLYTAPQEVTSNAEIAVAVISRTDPTKASSAEVMVLSGPTPITVSVAPGVASLYPSQAQQFTATVKGTANQGISWFVNGNEGGNSSVGTISSTGVYTAPPSPPAAHSVAITATSIYDTASSATAAVTILAGAAPATTWNPTVLGVPWASDFVPIAASQINVKTDSRLKVRAAGDGTTDDTPAIRAAIQLASSSGGGMVYFPTGDYKIVTPSGAVSGSPLVVPSRVILRGTSSTTSRIYVNDPNAASETDGIGTWGGIDFRGASLSGMTDLGVYAVNPSTSPCALLWNRGSSKVSEIFFNNLDVHLDNSKSFWLEAADKLLVQGSQFESNSSQYGPIYIVGNSNVSFLSNAITYHFGRVHLQNNASLLMQQNTLIRDAENKDMQDGTAIESGGVELSFDQNIQVLDNTIQTLNAPPDEFDDGEAIMTQQSNTKDVLDLGSLTEITSTTLTDANALWGPVTASRLVQYPEVVAVLTGPATGEWRLIREINASTKTLTLNQPWSPVPEVGSLYSIFVWTLMNATIQGNTLIDNPNGVVLYDGCYDCIVQGNVLTNSRGILLRTIDESLDQSVYPEGRRVHQVAIDNKILNNIVSNTLGVRPAYIALDAEAFAKSSYRGMGIINTQVGGNTISPYSANPSKVYTKGEIIQDGFAPCFLFGPAAAKDPVDTVFQDIYFWNNSQSRSVTYNSAFLPFTTRACITPSAPD